ncbi:MAG: GTPase domain-containing protein [Planctomycetaceae bacterium]|nr:GTPase domain-containing protein [Planctomycetaceae bacterium]
MSTYRSFAAEVQRFDRALAALEPLAAAVGVASPRGSEWFDLLHRKLLAQLDLPPLLVVAVVGGTNIGKSVLFNHLVGDRASASSPLAAGTKHPVCVTPPDLADPRLLQRLFESFMLCPWRSPDEPLNDSPENRLFWRIGTTMPPRLLLLDAPDVDSDATVNWDRARAIRQSADVLVAVLTQQKYNDAAVKAFFREAVEAQKPIVVVFNQCDLEADRAYWPQWLATFCEHTGARPSLVYVVPYDRRAAESLCLSFFAVTGDQSGAIQPANPREDLASLRFDEIKIQTFQGALRRVVDPQRGAPAYLETIRAAAESFASAASALEAGEMARVTWPSLPTRVLVDEIRRWWDDSRQPWSRQIHGFYRTLGRGATWPVRTAWNAMAGPPSDPLEVFGRQQREAVVSAVEKLLDQLDRLSQVGNDTLRPRLQRLLSGRVRADLLAEVEAAQQNLPAVDQPYRDFLREELDGWRRENPRAVRFLQSLDHAAAIARPVLTVGLFFTGLHVAGDLVGQAATGTLVSHAATEAAIAGGITGGGEALLTGAGEGVRQAAGRLFSRLQSQYAKQRAHWLAEWLERELLGDLLDELRRGAEIVKTPEFLEAEAIVKTL